MIFESLLICLIVIAAYVGFLIYIIKTSAPLTCKSEPNT